MLHTILALFSVFMLGMVFAIVLPSAIDYIKNKFTFTSEDASGNVEQLLRQNSKYNRKKVRQSKVFKDRLKSIIDLIEDASKSGKTVITITYMENCHTDREIRNVLAERKFDISTDWDGPNGLKIRWGNYR